MVLGTLGNNVPFVGLFGTVLGVMNAFLFLSSKSQNAEKMVFDQIAEALTSTAVGLIVAVPAVASFNYFTRRLRGLMSAADECAHQVLALLHGTLHQEGRPVVAKPKDADGG